jgi:membrane protein
MRLLNASGERVPSSLSKFFRRVWHRMDTDNVTALAAQVSYYFALALFPFLILLGAIVGTLPFTHAWQGILTWITNSLPGDTRVVVFEAVANLTQGHTSLLSFGLLGTIYAAASGLMSLTWALDVVYHVQETRSYLHRLGLCVLLLFVFATLLLASFGLLSAGDRLDRWLALRGEPAKPLLLLFPVVRRVVSVLLIIISLHVMDHFLPNLKRPWRWLRPGMGLMVAGWILAGLGFNWYVRHVASYNKTYGLLGGFVILMVWIYIAALIALVGGEIEAELRESRRLSAQQSIPSDASGRAVPAS